jgi:sugar phosphate isomerase/epimerase
MKFGTVICGPDVAYGPLALLSGSFEEKVRKAKRMGYHGIELMVRDPAGLDWPAVKQILDGAGLEVPQIVTGELFGADRLCLVTGDKDVARRAAERFRAVIDLAATLGAIVNMGRVRGRLDLLGKVDHPWEVAVAHVRAVAEYASAKGVRLTLEPLNRYECDFLLNTAEGLRFIEDTGCANLGLMLDLFHMNIEEASMDDALRQAGEKLWHVHIADSNRLYPGSGHTRFDSLFATLKDMGYQGYVSAEMFPVPDPDTAAEKTISFLKQYN